MIDNDFQKFAQTEKARRNRKNSKFKKSEGVNFDVKFRTEELTERKLWTRAWSGASPLFACSHKLDPITLFLYFKMKFYFIFNMNKIIYK